VPLKKVITLRAMDAQGKEKFDSFFNEKILKECTNTLIKDISEKYSQLISLI
jgi:hypothetical protein